MTTSQPPASALSIVHRHEAGVTLVELMIGLVLGSLVVLAATAMLIGSRATYRTQDETTRLAEASRFGLELSNRMVRLAGYTNFGDDAQSTPAAYSDAAYASWKTSLDSYAMNGPMIVGSNNSKPGGGAGLNGSDSLTIRFFGSSSAGTSATTGGTADGATLDCAGFPVPQPAQNDAAYISARAYNVLFVDADTDGEPALRCRRQTYDTTTGNPISFDTQTLIRGVESFQVLYAEAIPQGIPNDDLDQNPPQSIVYRTGIGGPNPVVEWKNVVAVRIALLVRSNVGALTDPDLTTKTYPLFGANYVPGTDPGANFSLATLSTADRTRARRIVQTTVFVRNRVSTWPSLQ
jgi:type IV pilus assembly protein PilW